MMEIVLIFALGFKGTSRGLKALQSYMNNSHHNSVLYWPEPTKAQSQYIKGTMGVLEMTGISHSDPWLSP